MDNTPGRAPSPAHIHRTSQSGRSTFGEESRLRPFPLEEYEARRERVYAHMKAEGGVLHAAEAVVHR